MKTILGLIGLFMFSVISWSSLTLADENEQSLDELKSAIEEIVKRKKLPSVSYALVNEDGIQALESLGMSNLDSLYRIGSTSKMFVALSVLKLVEEGKVSLDDTVRSLVPEIQFANKWEDTYPVKVVHLLEHTSGWDDMHTVEYAHNQADPISLLDALNFHPHSRVSRWVPGTRMAYCNTGPAVAAYIVEKISGQVFEDYVRDNFFKPLGMEGATYFNNDDYNEKGVTLYNSKMQPESYWNILYRPSGAINASIKDMAQFLKFFIGRGNINGEQIVSAESLERMERPADNLGAREGLELGYGLHNYSSAFENWQFREHNGAVNNGLSGFGYLPQAKAGFAVLLNSGDAYAHKEIEDKLRKFIVRNLEKPKVEKERELSEAQRSWAGYYFAINPRVDMSRGFTRLVTVFNVNFTEDKMRIKPLIGNWTAFHYPVTDTLFKSDFTGAMHVALVNDPLEGRVLHMESVVLKPISGFWVYFRLIAVVLWSILVLSSFVYFVVWAVLKGNQHPSANIKLHLHLLPLLASSSALVYFIINVLAMRDGIQYLSKPGFYSIGLMLASVLFFVFSLVSFVGVAKEWRSNINRLLYFYFALTAVLHVVVAIYMLRFGLIGIMTWA